MRDGCGGAAAGVLGDVPVFDADGIARGWSSRAVVWIGGYVANGEGVGHALYGEGLVYAERAVFLEIDGRVVLEEVGGRTDANALDDQVGVEDGAVFKMNGANVGWVCG